MRKSAFFPMVSGLVLLTIVLFLAVLYGRPAGAESYEQDDGLPDGPFVARVYYEQVSDIDALARYDVWEYNNLREKYVLVSMDRTIYHRLERVGWRMEIDQEATAMLTGGLPDTFYGGYRTVDELYTDLEAINAAYPDITELVDYGDSYCKTQLGCVTLGGDVQPGYDLLAMRVTNRTITGTKPVFFLMAGIHAREITVPEIAMRMLDWLVAGYNVNPDATWIVDHHEVWIVPSVNPDGHWIVELGEQPPYYGSPFWQRKNANRSNGCTTWPPSSGSQYGIDLNRNHSFMWGLNGSSPYPCDQTYRGPSAASEHEVNELQNLVLTLIPDQKGPNVNDPAPDDTAGLLITMHSYSQLVLWPWGYTTAAAPNRAGLETIGDKFATYNGYTSCQPSLCLYTVSGSTDDWSYGELGIPSYTFEIGYQFMPPYSEIDNVQWPDNGPALQYAAKIARTPYMLAYGPDALNVAATDNGDGTATLTATINDQTNGSQAITAANYFIDTPYWLTATTPISLPMTAVDGTFNSSVEAVEATVDLSGLAAGRHTLFVRGEDAGGHWGPVSAAFLTVTVQMPEAGFISSSPDLVGETTVFTNTSSGTDLTYEWDFGDGSPTSSEANPTHAYAAADTYTVTLTVSNDLGSDTAVGLVEIYPADAAPLAIFTSTSPDTLGQTTIFTNTSTGFDLTYTWDFGDGSPTSNEANPSHTYSSIGAYTVTLTAGNIFGSSTYTVQVDVTDPYPYRMYFPLSRRD